MDVQIVKMTGKEFERICKASGIDLDDIPDILKISRSSLYNYFERDTIPEKTEAKIDAHPELSKAKNYVLNKDLTKTENNEVTYYAGEKRLNEVTDTLKELMTLVMESFTRSDKQMQLIAEAHSEIKEDVKLFRDIIRKAHNEGKLIFVK